MRVYIRKNTYIAYLCKQFIFFILVTKKDIKVFLKFKKLSSKVSLTLD